MPSLKYSHKLKLLFSALVLFLFLFYRLAISETLQIRQDLEYNEQKLKALETEEKSLARIPPDKRSVRTLPPKSPEQVRSELATAISKLSEFSQCTVTEIPQPVVHTVSGIQVSTNSFVIEGGFIGLATLLRAVERDQHKKCKVVSARYYTLSEGFGRKKKLYLNLVTQTFQKL